MPWSTGTVSGATPAVDLMLAIKNALTGAGWTFVETTTASTYTADVLKNPATLNFWGQDFYIATVRSADTATVVGFRPFEAYNAAAHQMQKYAPAASQTLTPAVTTFLYSGADLTPAGTGAGCNVGVAINQITPYWIHVTGDRVVVATWSTSQQYCVYTGLVMPMNTVDPFPLIVVDLRQSSTSSNATYGSSTREPGQTASSAYNFYVQCTLDPHDALVPYYMQDVDLYTGLTWAGPALVSSSRSPTSAGVGRGILKDMYYTYLQRQRGGPGDTMLMGGTTYTRISPTSHYISASL